MTFRGAAPVSGCLRHESSLLARPDRPPAGSVSRFGYPSRSDRTAALHRRGGRTVRARDLGNQTADQPLVLVDRIHQAFRVGERGDVRRQRLADLRRPADRRRSGGRSVGTRRHGNRGRAGQGLCVARVVRKRHTHADDAALLRLGQAVARGCRPGDPGGGGTNISGISRPRMRDVCQSAHQVRHALP